MSGGKGRGLLRWSDAVAAQAAWIILAAVLLAGLAGGYTIRHLRIDTSTENMIAAEVPFRRHNIEYKQAFPRFRDAIVAVIESATPEAANRAALALADAVRQAPGQFAAVEASAIEPFFVDHGLLYLPQDELASLADRLAAAQPLLGALAADPSLRGLAEAIVLLRDHQAPDALPPAEIGRLYAAMADATDAAAAGRPGTMSWQDLLTEAAPAAAPHRRFVLIEPVLDYGSLAPAGPAIDALRAIAARLQLDAAHGIELRLTGEAMVDHEELESVAASTARASILTTVGVALLLVWGLRSLQLIVATLTMLTIGLVITAGLAALVVGQLNLISVTFAVLFVGLGDDFASHVALRYRESIERGEAHRSALRKAIAGSCRPLTLTAICAAVGFLAFVPTSYRGLAELGIISAMGMAVAWLGALTLLPALLHALRRIAWLRWPSRAPAAATIERIRRPVLVLAAAGALASAALLPLVGFDFNPLNLKDPASPAVATLRMLADDGAHSPNSIDILAADLEAAEATAARLARLPEVGEALTLASFVPAEQDAKLAQLESLAFLIGPSLDVAPAAPPDAPALRRALAELRAALQRGAKDDHAARLAQALKRFAQTAPDDAALADLDCRLAGFLPDLLERLRRGLNAGPVALDSLPPAVRDAWLTPVGQARLMVTPAAPLDDNAALGRFADAVLAVVPDATGTPVVVTEAGRVVIGAFVEASWLALAAITLLLLFVLRRLGDILLVYVPLLLALLYTAATMALLGLELNFANVIALPLLLGLGVSGAIHVVMRQNEAHGRSVITTSTPRAIMYSALTTIASFGSLAIATHRGLATMGQLLTIAVGWSLVCSLLILPCMLAALRRKDRAA
jgi:hypothetical protein